MTFNCAKLHPGFVLFYQIPGLSMTLLNLTCSCHLTIKMIKLVLLLGYFWQKLSLADKEMRLGPSHSLLLTTLIEIVVFRSIKCAAMNVPHLTIIFNDFAWPTIKFHDFTGLENEILEFDDFPGFQWLTRTRSSTCKKVLIILVSKHSPD